MVLWLYVLFMMVAASWGMLIPSLVVEAAEEEITRDGSYIYEELADGMVEITNYAPLEGASTEITIPGTLGGKTVTSIGRRAFYDCRSLESIWIPSSVTSIGNIAFLGCSSNALKGTNKKLTIKVPKKKVTVYKKYFKNKGNKTVKITK